MADGDDLAPALRLTCEGCNGLPRFSEARRTVAGSEHLGVSGNVPSVHRLHKRLGGGVGFVAADLVTPPTKCVVLSCLVEWVSPERISLELLACNILSLAFTLHSRPVIELWAVPCLNRARGSTAHGKRICLPEFVIAVVQQRCALRRGRSRRAFKLESAYHRALLIVRQQAGLLLAVPARCRYGERRDSGPLGRPMSGEGTVG